MWFVTVPEAKTAKNRLHFDLRPSGTLDDEVDRLTGLGASVAARFQEHVVMLDPEGNEFCVEPGSSPECRMTGESYVAIPPSGTGPGVLVLHPWWGLNGTVRGLCDRLAAEGFVTLAPDLYGGETTSDNARATELSDSLDLERGGPLVRSGLRQLLEHPATRGSGVAVLGLSMGAWFSFWLAAEEPEAIAAVVVFYGKGDGPFDVTRARYLGHFAENDDFEPLEGVRALEEQIRAAGREVTFHVYPGTGHWFFEPDVERAFDPEAARLAWDRTVAFLGPTDDRA